MAERDFSFGPISLDVARHCILRDGVPITRSPHRFGLLKALMEANRKVVSYDQLITSVWGEDSDVTFHTVIRTANDLKILLGEYGDFVQNKHGAGYYFRGEKVGSTVEVAAGLDVESLTLFESAEEAWRRRTLASLGRSLRLYEAVLERRPQNPSAHLGVANCLVLLAHAAFFTYRRNEIRSRAFGAVERALELSGDQHVKAAAYATRGKLRMMLDWDIAGAEDDFEQSQALDQKHASAPHGLAHTRLLTGRSEESLAAIRKALHLAPSSPMIHGSVGWILYLLGRTSEAITHGRSTLRVHEDFPVGYQMLGSMLQEAGQHKEGLDAFRTALELEPSKLSLAMLGHGHGRAGQKKRARQILAQLRRRARTEAVSPYFLAMIHVGLGEHEEALDGLEQARDEGFDWMLFIGLDPRWKPLDPYPRFHRLLATIRPRAKRANA